MSTSFEFMNNPVMPGMQQTGNEQLQQFAPQPMNYPMYQQPMYNTPQIEQPTANYNCGYSFAVSEPEEDEDDNTPSLSEIVETNKKKRGRPRKEKTNEIVVLGKSEVVDGNADPNDVSTIYNYMSTTMLLGDTLQQIDDLSNDVREELNAARLNRTLKNKQNYIVGLTEALGSLINSKVAAIREINNSITKAADLDYKKDKDRKAVETSLNDDKHIMDLYNAFITNPMNNQTPNILGPSGLNATVNSMNGNGIVRSPIVGVNSNQGQEVTDIGYLNYLSRITPEQNAMFYENDPNVKTVVVFDASTGQKFFQVMNVATGQVVPNVEPLDNRFMEDTTIDIKNKIAKNNNLRQTYPLVVINENIVKEY